MPPEDKIDSLERTRSKLYSPQQIVNSARSRISESGITNVPHAWGERIAPKAHRHVRLAIVFVIGAFGFFIVAVSVAALLFFTGTSSVSTNNINLTTQGPTTIAGGDTVPLSIAITNRNPVALTNVILEVDFPPGTRSADNKTQSYPRYSENIGTVYPGESISRSVKAVVFGTSGQSIQIPIALSYEAQGSNATFVKKDTYPLTISSAPLSISVDAPSEAVPGQPFTITVEARSNASTAIDNVILASVLPFGYSLTNASLPQSNSSFILGTLAPGDSKVVKLTGTLAGVTGDTRAFHFTIGTGNGPSDTAPALTYMQQESDIQITAPFLMTGLSLNGDTSSSPILAPGQNVVGTITWQNTLPVTLANASIKVNVSGVALAPNSLKTSNGFFDSTTNTITFDRSTDPSLGTLAAGASGVGSFSFATSPNASRNPIITFSISISGQRVGESNVPTNVTASSVIRAKVASAVVFSSASLHSSGPIVNSGPVPPVAGKATTYTISWSLANSGNDITSAQVTATLPSYVTFTNQELPADAIIYDPTTRTITWRPGDIAAGANASASFQLSITPSTTQRASQPLLTSSPAFTGFDRFTQTQLTATAPAPSTETPSDPVYSSGKGTVQ